MSTSELANIADELHRAIEGDPWHGSSTTSILRDVSLATASAKPGASVHSIRELVLHMTAWANEVTRRLDGHPAREPEEGDWPAPAGNSDNDWQRDLANLTAAHKRVVQKALTLAEESLHAKPVEDRDAPTGSGVTKYVLLHGLAQHHAYHSGQIALLKKLVARD